ncbi:MAG: nuclear transport factor 2 family protein [Pseudomonadota bacterium]
MLSSKTGRTTVAHTFLEAMMRKDVEAAMAYFNELSVWEIAVNTRAHPAAGLACGETQIEERLLRFMNEFEFISLQPTHLDFYSEDDLVGMRCRIRLRERETGEPYGSVVHYLFRIEGGVIIRLDEGHDTGRFQAYLGYVHSLKTSSVPANCERRAKATRSPISTLLDCLDA